MPVARALATTSRYLLDRKRWCADTGPDTAGRISTEIGRGSKTPEHIGHRQSWRCRKGRRLFSTPAGNTHDDGRNM